MSVISVCGVVDLSESRTGAKKTAVEVMWGGWQVLASAVSRKQQLDPEKRSRNTGTRSWSALPRRCLRLAGLLEVTEIARGKSAVLILRIEDGSLRVCS